MHKKKWNALFLLTCLSLTVVVLWTYFSFLSYFQSDPVVYRQLENARQQIEEERSLRHLAEVRLLDFSQEVALRLPLGTRQELLMQGYDLAELATVTRTPASQKIELSGVKMESAREAFREKNFTEARTQFREVMKKYPHSPRYIEAVFFAAESAFLLGDFKEVLDLSQHLLLQFPDHELTGFILLRVGQMSELNKKPKEALEIYQTVQRHFQHKQLKEQAKVLESSVRTN